MPNALYGIDLTGLIPLIRLNEVLPPMPSGKPRSRSAPYRWASVGVGGRKLATVQVGGVKYVRPEDLLDFLGIAPSRVTPATKARQSHLAQVDRELAALGLHTD